MLSATSWGDEEFDDRTAEDFGPKSNREPHFYIGQQPGPKMDGFFIESRPVMSTDLGSHDGSDSYISMFDLSGFHPPQPPANAFAISVAVPRSAPTVDWNNLSYSSGQAEKQSWELPEGEELLRVVPDSKKHQKNYQARPPAVAAPSRQKRKQLSPVAAAPESSSTSADGRVSVFRSALSVDLPRSHSAAPPTKKAKKERVTKENWNPTMMEMEDEDVQRIKVAITEKVPETIYILEADSLKDKKVSPLLRTLLFARELPENFLLLVAKSEFLSPVCSSCSVPFPGKMKESAQRLLLRKSSQQPAGMGPAEFWSQVICKLLEGRASPTTLAVITGDKRATFKWTNSIRNRVLKPVLVDVSGEEETVGDYCPKSLHPSSLIPTMNSAVSDFLARTKVPTGDEQTFLQTLSRSDSTEAREVSAAAYSSLAEERSVQTAVGRVRDWLYSRRHEGSLPSSRAALGNAIAKSLCKVKESSDGHAIIRALFQNGVAAICSTCGNLALKRGAELEPFVPRDKFEAANKFGAAISGSVMKVLGYLLPAKATVPTSFAGLQNIVDGFCNQFKLVPSTRVVDRLFSLGLISDAAQIDMHTAGANAYLNKGQNAIAYNWDAIEKSYFEAQQAEQEPEDAHADDDPMSE